MTTTGILLSKVSRVEVANKIAVPKSRNEIFLGGLFSGLAHGLLWPAVFDGTVRYGTGMVKGNTTRSTTLMT